MEKYFTIKETEQIYINYFKFLENRKIILDLVKEFLKEHGIESTGFYVRTDRLYIAPTVNDEVKFGNVLGKVVNDGLRPFKKTSKINKLWVEILKSKELKVMHKPTLFEYLYGFYGHYSSRLFNVGNALYCSFSAELGDIKFPEGFVEMKASEFFKVIEDNSNK